MHVVSVVSIVSLAAAALVSSTQPQLQALSNPPLPRDCHAAMCSSSLDKVGTPSSRSCPASASASRRSSLRLIASLPLWSA